MTMPTLSVLTGRSRLNALGTSGTGAFRSSASEIGSINLGSSAHYELKFKGPEGIVVDIGHWVGTAPIEEPARA